MLGHVMRMQNDHPAKKALNIQPEEKRKSGWLHTTWKGTLRPMCNTQHIDTSSDNMYKVKGLHWTEG